MSVRFDERGGLLPRHLEHESRAGELAIDVRVYGVNDHFAAPGGPIETAR